MEYISAYLHPHYNIYNKKARTAFIHCPSFLEKVCFTRCCVRILLPLREDHTLSAQEPQIHLRSIARLLIPKAAL